MSDAVDIGVEQDTPVESLTLTSLPDADRPYIMHIGLRVLDHLGIRLYSNAAAVLSEVVANAWDADSDSVEIDLQSNQIVIVDDGIGMDLDAINDRFLSVGYDKRTKEGTKSARGRDYMGRKGIGKLSLFSIAEKVDVHTTKNGQQHAFRMSVPDIEVAIENKQPYRPVPISFAGNSKGTKIVLSALKTKRVKNTANALVKRIARRFSILGTKTPGIGPFDVIINKHHVNAADRDDLAKIEFLWEFGDKHTDVVGACKNLKFKDTISDVVQVDGREWRVRGWLGTAARPKDLRTDESGSMNGVVVIARGRLIQENILDRLGFNRLLVNYVVGQIEADFLDLDDQEDIATSDRQRLIEDDVRYLALVAFLRQSLLSISETWTLKRNETRGDEVQAQVPPLARWIDSLPEGQQKPAKSMLGVIQGIEIEDEEERNDLYKAGVLAFERLRLKEASHQLANLEELTARNLLPLLSDLSALEGSMYRDIVKQRLTVIEKFDGLVNDDEKEKVLQECLFKHMWLLDPGWERATDSERMEQTLKRDFGVFASDLDDDQSKGRIDIRYKNNAGQHIIVELKRAGRKLSTLELVQQGMKYKDGLEACLKKQHGDDYNPNIAIVFVLGREVDEMPNLERVKGFLAPINARIVYYQQLIESAEQAYGEYLSRSEEVDSIDEILKELKK
ncbi:BbrUII/HgiDII family restriction enzyme [Comamonas aquatica]|uniref:BbrUII/HgiDII family restriction enzyme n=1 Tax=Comamonas aquatica TaxID=225991 RepID=UPI002447003A|nr:ATP-binding protein [Comamonas aquatica]MDH1445695.1 ATP-binding protein [Comamonas aquatica]